MEVVLERGTLLGRVRLVAFVSEKLSRGYEYTRE